MLFGVYVAIAIHIKTISKNIVINKITTVWHKTLVGENFDGFGGSLPIRQSFIC